MPEVLPDHPWLASFPAEQRPPVRMWFSYCLSQGARRPEVLLDMVQRIVTSKREWSVSLTSIALCDALLAALRDRRGEALDYARTLLYRQDV
jgi:hypothetical protein